MSSASSAVRFPQKQAENRRSGFAVEAQALQGERREDAHGNRQCILVNEKVTLVNVVGTAARLSLIHI